MIIGNGSSIPLNASAGSVPDMSTALYNWMQPMTFSKIVKTIVDFQVVETPTVISFQGVWQPFSPQMLAMKPEGQRQWKWFMLHSPIALSLSPDEVVTYLGTQFRVMSTLDYKLYGYFQYELVDDFTGSDP